MRFWSFAGGEDAEMILNNCSGINEIAFVIRAREQAKVGCDPTS